MGWCQCLICSLSTTTKGMPALSLAPVTQSAIVRTSSWRDASQCRIAVAPDHDRDATTANRLGGHPDRIEADERPFERGDIVGGHYGIDRLQAALAGHPIPFDMEQLIALQERYAVEGLASVPSSE